MKKLLSITLAVMFSMAILVGCSKSTPSDTQTAQTSVNASLAGKYILVSWEDENGDYLSYIISEGIRPESVYLELRSDGTYTWDLSALDMGIDKGTYKVSGSTTLILTYDGGEDVLTITDGRLYLEEASDILVFARSDVSSVAQETTPSLKVLNDKALKERYFLRYSQELDGVDWGFINYEELGLSVGDLYLELLDDGTAVLDLRLITGNEGDIYIGTYRLGEGTYSSSPNSRDEGDLTFEWDGVNGRSAAIISKETELNGGGYKLTCHFDMNGRILSGSFDKELSTPALSFTGIFPDSMLGVYAMTFWSDKNGVDNLAKLAHGGIRADLHYIDFLSGGKFKMSLHASRPGDIQTGSYRMQGDTVTLIWDDTGKEDTAIMNGSMFALDLSNGEKMVFNKEGLASYTPSSASYSGSYFGTLQGSAKVLEETVLLVSIFVTTDESPWNEEEMKNVRGSLREAMSFMEAEALSYGKHLRFYHHQTDTANKDLFYHMDYDGVVVGGNGDWDAMKLMKKSVNNFIENNIPYSELADKYQTDNISYVVFFNSPGLWFAYPYYADDPADEKKVNYHEKSFIFCSRYNWQIIAHEILHTFGAVDLYYTFNGKELLYDKYVDYDGDMELLNYVTKNYSREIMRSATVFEELIPIISPLNAYRLGWLDDIPELKQFPRFRLPGNVPGIWAHYSYKPPKN